MKKTWSLLFLLLLSAGFLSAAQEQSQEASVEALEVPQYQDSVTDLPHVLDAAETEILKGKIRLLQLATTTQIGILIIPDLQGQELEKYSLKVANTWKLGRCDIHNGVFILIAMKDRALRIEVGLGLEFILTNDECQKIISRDMVPYFKKGEIFRGLDSGLNSIIQILTSSQEYRDLYSRPCECSGTAAKP